MKRAYHRLMLSWPSAAAVSEAPSRPRTRRRPSSGRSSSRSSRAAAGSAPPRPSEPRARPSTGRSTWRRPRSSWSAPAERRSSPTRCSTSRGSTSTRAASTRRRRSSRRSESTRFSTHPLVDDPARQGRQDPRRPGDRGLRVGDVVAPAPPAAADPGAGARSWDDRDAPVLDRRREDPVLQERRAEARRELRQARGRPATTTAPRSVRSCRTRS